MRFKNRNLFLVLSAVIVAIAACDKTELSSTEYDFPDGKAYVRFAMLSPATSSVMIKVDTTKIIASTSGSSGLFPIFANVANYAVVNPGGTVRVSLPNTSTSNDSVLIFSGKLNLEAGKYYSVTLADTGVDRTVFVIDDVFSSLPPDSMMNIRFINAMAKTQPLSLIRVDSTSPTVVTRDTIFRNIAFKEASPFVRVRVFPRNGLIRYRMVVTSTNQPIGPSPIFTPSTALFYRSVTFYGSGFGNGTGLFVPNLIGPVYNQ